MYTEIKRKSLASELLLEIVKRINSSLSSRKVLESIIDNVFYLVNYDDAAILLVNQDKNVLQKAVARGYNGKLQNLFTLKLNQGISGWVIQIKKGVIISDVRLEPRYYPAQPKTRSQVTVPIISQGDAIGALVLESNKLDYFTEAHLELLMHFSELAAIAIHNARLYEDSLNKVRMENDLLVASKVQQALLPKSVPTINGINIAEESIPSRIVGGDLYDVFRLDKHRLGIVIGDGSGDGASGAMLMAVAYAGYKSLLNEIRPVKTLVSRLNDLLAEITTTAYFVTFFLGILDREKNTLIYCNAGHNPPLLLRNDRTIEHLHQGGTVLGFLKNQPYTVAETPLDPGNYVCLYTDGVIEMQNENEEEFGEERLAAILREHYGKSPEEIKSCILTALRDFAGTSDFNDDVSLIIVRME